MDNNEYLNRLMDELNEQGIEKPISHTSVCLADDKDLHVINRLEDINHQEFSDEQRAILMHKGSAAILATAGAGKTQTSVNLIAKRIITGEIDPDRMVFTTYSKAGSEEMKTRLERLLKELGIRKKVQVRTLHSFFLQLLRTFGISSDIISEGKRREFVKESCKDADFATKDDELLIIDNLLSYQVNNLLSDEKTVSSYVNTLDELTVEKYKAIRQGYVNRKAQAKLIDYDDMQSYLYIFLVRWKDSGNPSEHSQYVSVRNYCRALYDYFFIDEAQDVSKIQFAIVRAIIVSDNDETVIDKQLVFIGDDDQCIYEWRGSDPSIILSVGPEFNIPTFVLSTNYRCKSEIVNYAAASVTCNTSRYDKSMQAFKEGGNVKIAVCEKDDLCSLSTVAYYHIKHLVDSGEKLSDIAVLCRNNFHLAILSNMLLKNGIYCYLSDDMKLTKSYQFKDIDNIIAMCQYSNKHEIIKNVLWKLCRYMNISNANMIAAFMNNSNLAIHQTLGYLLQNTLSVDVGFHDNVNIPLQALEKIKYYTRGFSRDTVEDLEEVYRALKIGVGDPMHGDNGNPAECLRVLLYKYINSTKFLNKTLDKQRSIQGIVVYISKLTDKLGYDGLLEFLRITKQFESGASGIVGDRVTLTTMHSAKGREWKNVIMFACDNVSVPSLDGINKMVSEGVSISDIYANIEQERRLVYVGNTRAKENLLVITGKMPSMFILESLGCIKQDFNSEIYNLAMDGNRAAIYSSFIAENLLNPDSKYYYDIQTYRK